MAKAMLHRYFVPLVTVLLAACSHSSPQPGEQDSDGVIHMTLPSGPTVAEVAPQQPDGGQWSAQNGGLAFGVPGQAPLLTLSCTHAADGSARIRFTRRTRADQGAEALFAIEGNLHVARVPMNVVQAGDPGLWQGDIDAHLETIGAIKGGNTITATLPGGGALKLPPNAETGRLLDACRTSDKKAAVPEASAG